MADEITLNFIEDYRNFPQLWDPNNKLYTNKVKRNDGLQVLATKYNMDIDGVKKKIKSLRSYFSKEHQKVMKKKSGSGSDEIYVSPWFAYKHLLFTADSVTPRKTRESSTEEEKVFLNAYFLKLIYYIFPQNKCYKYLLLNGIAPISDMK